MKPTSFALLITTLAALLAGPAFADDAVTAGRDKAAMCVTCHGEAGEGIGEYAALAGLESDALVASMQAYKNGDKAEPMMQMLMQSLSDDDIANLAAFFASLPPAE